MTEGEEPLAQALCKNILNGEKIEQARRLARYAEAAIAALAGLDDATLRRASWQISLASARGRAAMNRTTDMTDKPDPWRVPVIVAQIPDTGLHRDIEAEPGRARGDGRGRRLARNSVRAMLRSM